MSDPTVPVTIKKKSVPSIGLDMSRISPDVNRYGNRKLDHVFEIASAGIIIHSPKLNVHTIAAGGSS